MGIEPRANGPASAQPRGQAHLQAKKRDGGTKLRRRQTTARPSLCQNARAQQGATAVPAGRNGAEHQEDRPAAEQNGAKHVPFYASGASGRMSRPMQPVPRSDHRASQNNLNRMQKQTPPK